MQRKSLLPLIMLGLAPTVMADDHSGKQNWVGGFVEYNQLDGDKPPPTGYLDDGYGLGFEFGYMLNENWAARVEVSRLDIDVDATPPVIDDKTGTRYGIDAMVFMDDDLMYLFGGAKFQDLGDTYRMANVGIGKHWQVADSWRIITEAATYYDFGQGYNDYSFKLGLAYAFGAPAAAPSAPKDSDNDGVMDGRDMCPNTPAGVAVDENGCNNDRDGDGVINANDECPQTLPGTKVDAKGCAMKAEADSDGDGVVDSKDACPNTPRTDKVDATGCSVFTEQQVAVQLNVLFANNSDVIENPADSKFQDFANFMRRFPNTKAEIAGHTSSVGNADYNQQLSERRANAVRTLLIERYNIAASRLTAVGYGETRLLDTANTAAAHAANRRIEATVSAMEKVKVSRD
ncbi:OmpA family protein [Aestuariibacter salexigens]|uniref:OmpA family protein n=1 Tax=Aestuariibacter salexigens TaxID=226010 RepID=UPI0003FD2751|nr:OmpA family protein [Aestuariibacter salexigens]